MDAYEAGIGSITWDIVPKLSQRMREAANTVQDFNKHNGYSERASQAGTWSPRELREQAKVIEAEERAESKLAALVAELARALFRANRNHSGAKWEDNPVAASRYTATATVLVGQGWARG